MPNKWYQSPTRKKSIKLRPPHKDLAPTCEREGCQNKVKWTGSSWGSFCSAKCRLSSRKTGGFGIGYAYD